MRLPHLSSARYPWLLICTALGGLACGSLIGQAPSIDDEPPPAPNAVPSSTPEISAVSPAPTPAETTATAPESDWTLFHDDLYGLSFRYPAGWLGPEVHRWDGGISAEVGTDVVYPFGTGREERVYEKENAYYVSIQYVLNREGWTWEQFLVNQPWAETYLTVVDLNDGESTSDARSLIIRQRSVTLGAFSGVEYISTLSETAQTELHYAREAVLFDVDLNHLRVRGSPNNVAIQDGETWRRGFERVDADHLEAYRQILQSISID